eukprot:SAG11_NODE_1492_length_4807_cov_2.686703_3_plen_77_part_00
MLELLTLLLYLLGRTLARRAFPGDPSAEAQCLFVFLLISDAFAELAFVSESAMQHLADFVQRQSAAAIAEFSPCCA